MQSWEELAAPLEMVVSESARWKESAVRDKQAVLRVYIYVNVNRGIHSNMFQYMHI